MSPSIYVLLWEWVCFYACFWAQKGVLARRERERESSNFRASLKMPAFVLKGAAPIKGVQTCFPLNSTASYFYFSPCMLGIQSWIVFGRGRQQGADRIRLAAFRERAVEISNFVAEKCGTLTLAGCEKHLNKYMKQDKLFTSLVKLGDAVLESQSNAHVSFSDKYCT